MTTTKNRVRSTVDFTLRKTDMEISKGKSETIQDDSYSIKELLEKHTRGLDPRVSKIPIFNESELDDLDLEKFSRGDVGEKHRIANSHLGRAKEIRDQEKKEKKAADQKAADDKWAEYEKLKKEVNEQKKGKSDDKKSVPD